MIKQFAWLFWLLIWGVVPASFAQTAALPVYDCVQHGTQAQTSGLKSSNYLQGIIPSCTVTVFLTGTQTIATTSPQSPFVANTDGSIPPIFAAVNVGYDVMLSGGVPPNVYPSPVTLTGLYPGFQFTGGGGLPSGTAGQFLQYQTSGTTVTAESASGDLTLATDGTFTLNSVNSDTGTCGDSTHVGQVTLNVKGLATACTPVAISFPSTLTVQTGGTNNTSQSLLNFTVTANTGVALTNPSGGIENAAGVVMGASGSSHAQGMVPDPGATAGTTHYLREDGSWDVPTGASPAGSLKLQASNSGGTAQIVATPAIMYGSVNYTNGGTLFGFGDSTMAGTAGASVVDKAFFSVICHDYGGTCNNQGNSGAQADTIMEYVFGDYTVTDYLNFSRIILDAGINDANTCGNTTGCLNNYALEMNAGITWLGLPYTQKVMASTATATGTWGSGGGGFPIATLPGLTGNAQFSTTNGSTLTFTISSGIAGPAVGLTWEPLQAGTGTFTVSVDGTLQTNLCTGTTTFDAFGCNGQALSSTVTAFRQQFSVTAGVSHTIVVTTVGTGGVIIVDADSTLTAPSPTAPLVIVSGVIYQNTNTDAAATAAFNTAAAAAAAAGVADNMNVVFADVRSGTPGVNSSTDMGTSTLCGSNNPGSLHPNDCGNFHWAQTIENAAAAAGFAFTIPNSGGRSGYFTAPLSTGGTLNNNTVLLDWQPNASGGYQGIETGIGFFPPNGSFLSRMAFGKDNASGAFATQIMTYGAQRTQFTTCTTGFPTAESQCTETFGVDNATGNGTFKGTVNATGFNIGGAPLTRALGWGFGDAATSPPLTTSEVGYITVPFACTITGWRIMANTGTVTIKTARVATGGTALPTLGANSISTSGVSLSSGTLINSTTLTDFTSTTINAGDTLGFFITAVSSAAQVTFSLDCAQ